ncbi:MAG: YraN family protein [Bacteroidota bacterium]
MNHKTIGDSGEAQALKYLVKNNYEVLERNFRHRRGEIDIICLKSNTLIFIEVKKRKNIAYGYPEEFVSKAQEKMIMDTADHYIYAINWQKNIRYDIISITGEELYHIKDAFY